MVPSEKKPPSRNALTWLIFCALASGAMIGGLLLPGAFSRRAQERENIPGPTAAVPAPQHRSQAEHGSEAKNALEYEPPALPEIAQSGPMLLRLTLSTIIILLLCIFILWAGKRWVRPLAAPIGENRKLRLLESLPLGGRCSVFLLQAGETNVLVGLDQAGIKALLPLPQPFDNSLAELTAPSAEHWAEGMGRGAS
jgi:flagellar protein FliO/FliZ